MNMWSYVLIKNTKTNTKQVHTWAHFKLSWLNQLEIDSIATLNKYSAKKTLKKHRKFFIQPTGNRLCNLHATARVEHTHPTHTHTRASAVPTCAMIAKRKEHSLLLRLLLL